MAPPGCCAAGRPPSSPHSGPPDHTPLRPSPHARLICPRTATAQATCTTPARHRSSGSSPSRWPDPSAPPWPGAGCPGGAWPPGWAPANCSSTGSTPSPPCPPPPAPSAS
ncbi:hypothetical protein ACFFX0_13185 [Citricoccus parietis]|uniref:Uncharacterized protein n=1 Tax=Citricoccus parietis TaxID=592307 RepID=A0ABV5FZI4_9MICC